MTAKTSSELQGRKELQIPKMTSLLMVNSLNRTLESNLTYMEKD